MINFKDEKQVSVFIGKVWTAKHINTSEVTLWRYFNIKRELADHYYWYHILIDIRKEINERFNPKI